MLKYNNTRYYFDGPVIIPLLFYFFIFGTFSLIWPFLCSFSNFYMFISVFRVFCFSSCFFWLTFSFFHLFFIIFCFPIFHSFYYFFHIYFFIYIFFQYFSSCFSHDFTFWRIITFPRQGHVFRYFSDLCGLRKPNMLKLAYIFYYVKYVGFIWPWNLITYLQQIYITVFYFSAFFHHFFVIFSSFFRHFSSYFRPFFVIFSLFFRYFFVIFFVIFSSFFGHRSKFWSRKVNIENMVKNRNFRK